MVRIAVTGGVASGKSTVCNYFREKDIVVISLDEIAHRVVLPGEKAYQEIVRFFGSGAVLEDGMLDRPFLRDKMTADPGAKSFLESTVQPEILNTMNREMMSCEADGDRFVVVEVPLLFETGLEAAFDVSLLVCVSGAAQLERLMQRDGVTKEGAEALIRIQMSQEEKRQKADYVVENTGDIDSVYKYTDAVFKKIVEKFDNISK